MLFIFNGYTKINTQIIENTKSIKSVKKWCVTEKIHGANFCFIYNINNNTIEYGKRKMILLDDDYFFGYKDILPDILPKIQSLLNHIMINTKLLNKNDKYILIYGELFGGEYPNINTNFKPVQSGIYYSPNLHFYAFDISIINYSNEEKYIDFEQSIILFEYSKLLYAKPLAIYNTFSEADNYNIYFNSHIPKILNLPELPNNKAEGIIIRSMQNHILIKKKIKEFSESIYNDNNYIETDNVLYRYKQLANKHLTINRLNNAISKIGILDEKNKNEIFELCADDILYEIDGFSIHNLREWLIEQVNLMYINNKNQQKN